MAQKKVITPEEAAALIKDGSTVLFGGFLGCGSAHKVIDAISKSGVKDLTVVCNDGGIPNGPLGEEWYGIAKLIANRQVKRLITTHVGMNPQVALQNMQEGTLEVNLIPQGSLAEMIRAGGAGLGAVVTPTGVGTIVEESPLCLGKQVINGREYLMMAPVHGDVAVCGISKVDKAGNGWYKGSTVNFNLVMATAADTVIAECEELVEVGEIEPENVRTYGVFVDYIVEGGKY